MGTGGKKWGKVGKTEEEKILPSIKNKTAAEKMTRIFADFKTKM